MYIEYFGRFNSQGLSPLSTTLVIYGDGAVLYNGTTSLGNEKRKIDKTIDISNINTVTITLGALTYYGIGKPYLENIVIS